ncbi:hypothetical protein [Pseudomonas paraveronii]|uniref:hypothetical protein n=1 Tax=Pseudomonas paraveronii TaxID=3040598 RepID=UPI002AB001F0|nr:hypothetical protein [Pseudomonas sp. FLM 11]
MLASLAGWAAPVRLNDFGGLPRAVLESGHARTPKEGQVQKIMQPVVIVRGAPGPATFLMYGQGGGASGYK